MPHEKRILADVGIKKVPFPMTVLSREDDEGQKTVANISIHARIIQEFEANWIDKFMQVLHNHRNKIGTSTLKVNIYDYLKALMATSVSVDFEYPYFVEKTTPLSKEKCLVRYQCQYTAKLTASSDKPKITFKIEIPTITTDPASDPDRLGGLFGQLSIVSVKVESFKNIFAEDLIEIVDRHALSSIYSFLTEEDRIDIITKVHREKISSVVMVNEIQNDLAKNQDVDWYSVQCNNFSLLHSYNTLVATEKSMWIPSSCYDFEEL